MPARSLGGERWGAQAKALSTDRVPLRRGKPHDPPSLPAAASSCLPACRAQLRARLSRPTQHTSDHGAPAYTAHIEARLVYGGTAAGRPELPAKKRPSGRATLDHRCCRSGSIASSHSPRDRAHPPAQCLRSRCQGGALSSLTSFHNDHCLHYSRSVRTSQARSTAVPPPP